MKRVWSITLGLLLILTTACQAVPPDLVTAVGDEFARDGKAYRFISMNIRGIAHYGGGDGALPYTSTSHIGENLDGAAALGCRVIRVFAANKNISVTENVTRIGYLLDQANLRGIKAILALTDFYPTPFHPAGDDGYYTQNPWGWTVLNHAWFAGGYEVNYKPWVTAVVTAYKDHPAVFSWQLGNEIADQVSADTHDAFVMAMAAHIKSIDPYHMVSIGMLSLEHIPGYTVSRGVALYSNPNLDFITAHRYNDQSNPTDFAVRDTVHKPIVMSEMGCNKDHAAVTNGDRVAFMDARFDEFVVTKQARGFMNWGYQAQSWDIGDGDGSFGIDRYSHPDYNAMVAMYAGHAAELNAYDAPVGLDQGPRGRNLSLEAVAVNVDTFYSAGFTGDAAVDGSLQTKWTSTNASSTHWLLLDFGQPLIITGFREQHAGAGGETAWFNHHAYEHQVADSPSGPWQTVSVIDNSGEAATVETKLATAVKARYARLWITDCGIDDYARLYEWEVIGDPDPLGDCDSDGDLDLLDLAAMQACTAGAGVTPPEDVRGCPCSLANTVIDAGEASSGDVDVADYLGIEACVGGADLEAGLDCY